MADTCPRCGVAVERIANVILDVGPGSLIESADVRADGERVFVTVVKSRRLHHATCVGRDIRVRKPSAATPSAMPEPVVRMVIAGTLVEADTTEIARIVRGSLRSGPRSIDPRLRNLARALAPLIDQPEDA